MGIYEKKNCIITLNQSKKNIKKEYELFDFGSYNTIQNLKYIVKNYNNLVISFQISL